MAEGEGWDAVLICLAVGEERCGFEDLDCSGVFAIVFVVRADCAGQFAFEGEFADVFGGVVGDVDCLAGEEEGVDSVAEFWGETHEVGLCCIGVAAARGWLAICDCE